MRDPKLIDKFAAALPAPEKPLLDELLRIAEPQGVSLYLVGGPLRDLLLDRPSLDIDIAVEGDAPAMARQLAEASGGRAVIHPAFLTATVRIAGHRLDLNTARSETYARPGALPTVRPATIREDLLRRDFTINALALRLNGPQRGELLDPIGGLRDLDARVVRVLHGRSFQDDATRILRAFRYATRLGFEIGLDTLSWLKRDIRYLETISGARIHRELARILEEPNPEIILRRLEEIGALAVIHPTFHFEPEQAEAFTRVRELHPIGPRASYWPILAWRISEAEAAALARRLAFTGAQRRSVEAMSVLQRPERMLTGSGLRRDAPQERRRTAAGTSTLLPSPKRSAIAEMLSPFPLPALSAFAALTDVPALRDRLLDYLTKARKQRTHLTGDDLRTMGVPQGPQLGGILRRLRNARLDGEITSRGDEERLARQLIAESDKAHRSQQKVAPSRSS